MRRAVLVTAMLAAFLLIPRHAALAEPLPPPPDSKISKDTKKVVDSIERKIDGLSAKDGPLVQLSLIKSDIVELKGDIAAIKMGVIRRDPKQIDENKSVDREGDLEKNLGLILALVVLSVIIGALSIVLVGKRQIRFNTLLKEELDNLTKIFIQDSSNIFETLATKLDVDEKFGKLDAIDERLTDLQEIVTEGGREARETAARETAAREAAARETAARETAARETAARETAARETAARETAARETAARETAARETAAREAAAREDAAREARDVADRARGARQLPRSEHAVLHGVESASAFESTLEYIKCIGTLCDAFNKISDSKQSADQFIDRYNPLCVTVTCNNDIEVTTVDSDTGLSWRIALRDFGQYFVIVPSLRLVSLRGTLLRETQSEAQAQSLLPCYKVSPGTSLWLMQPALVKTSTDRLTLVKQGEILISTSGHWAG